MKRRSARPGMGDAAGVGDAGLGLPSTKGNGLSLQKRRALPASGAWRDTLNENAALAAQTEGKSMKIAAYVDDDERVASVYETGRLLLFDNAEGPWAMVKEIDFTIRRDRGLAGVKAAVREAAARMEGSSVFLSAEVRGLVHSILQEELGFHIWKSEGSLRNQLDVVAAKEAELAAAPPSPPIRPEAMGCGCQGGWGGGPRLKRTRSPAETVSCPGMEELGEGHYRIDLGAVLENNPGLNSRTVLVPVLEGSRFARLEILCNHVPRWFAQAVAELDLRAEYKSTGNGVTMDVYFDT